MRQFLEFFQVRQRVLFRKAYRTLNVLLVESFQNSNPRSLSKIWQRLHQTNENWKLLKSLLLLESFWVILGSFWSCPAKSKKVSTITYRKKLNWCGLNSLVKPFNLNINLEHGELSNKRDWFKDFPFPYGIWAENNKKLDRNRSTDSWLSSFSQVVQNSLLRKTVLVGAFRRKRRL